jgi:serine/threonine protein kinase
MATVYLAHDLRHVRPVALKVIRPELATTLGTERFLREIRVTAQLHDRGTWALVRAQLYHLRGDRAMARVYADSARIAFEAQLRATPSDALLHVFRGLALAYLGRKAEAKMEGERGADLLPIGRDGIRGPRVQHQLVRIYILVGEPEKALDRLEPLLAMPYWLSPGWLRIDPTFAPLRGNPRFERADRGEVGLRTMN